MSKYKKGDYVLIKKIFKNKPMGHYEYISGKVAKVVNVQETVTFGPAYSLEIDGKVNIACYWESDIECLADSEDRLWETWGDQ